MPSFLVSTENIQQYFPTCRLTTFSSIPQNKSATLELSFLAYLRGRCRSLPQVHLGIGDDAAAIRGSDRLQLSCTDQIIDGVDFISAKHDLADVGYKAVAINVSDIAAMGGDPRTALVTLTLPRTNATQTAGHVYEGILEAAAEYNLAIAGGDISTYEGPLAISVCMLGEVEEHHLWRRSGAKEGDAILITGPVGGSISGRHLRPKPRIPLVKTLRSLVSVTAAIDISDGLSLDLDRLCAASGVGAELETECIPIHSDAVALSETSGRSAFQHAWSDGEDFELILTMSQAEADLLRQEHSHLGLHQIGKTVGRTGLWKKHERKLERLPPQGYMH